MSNFSSLRQLLVGRPIHRKDAHHQRLNVPLGLAVFASDALSSVAYSTEEVLLVLILAGSLAAYSTAWPIAVALVCLMVVVGFSYYQTVHAYPNNGGTYVVSKTNLGPFASQVAGAALLTDYVLTVAVSISSGVQALVSIWPGLHGIEVGMACLAIAFLCIINLRGAKESGLVFAVPTFLFVVLILTLIGKSLITGFHTPATPPTLPPGDGIHFLGSFLILRGFAASCTALTGTEAIANGVKAFRKPEARHASQAISLMVALLGIMFLGITWGVLHAGIVPLESGQPGYQTVLAQFAKAEFGNGFMFQATLIAAAGVLFLAANTAYADFPRLASFMAEDGFLPRRLAVLGDRLVYQNGIILLTIISAGLIFLFHADTHALIPLYALGVFIAFTLSQTGMVIHFLKALRVKKLRYAAGHPEVTPKALRGAVTKLRLKMALSGVGAVMTLVVAGILLVTKWEERAYLVVFAMGLLIFGFRYVRRHYDRLAEAIAVNLDAIPTLHTSTLLLVPRVHQGLIQAVQYAQQTSKDCRALHVALNPQDVEKVKRDWDTFVGEMPLIILDSPYRSIVEPVTEYIDSMLKLDKKLTITVIVPEAVPNKWWQRLLHNNLAPAFMHQLGRRNNVVITNVRYHLPQDI